MLSILCTFFCIHDFDSIPAKSTEKNTYCSQKIKNKIRTFEPEIG